MALFNKTPKTAEDVMKLIKGLSDEELDKLGEMLSADDDDNGKPDTEEMIDKAEENIEEKGADTQTEEDRVDESVAAQEKADGEEDSQDAKDRVNEAEGKEAEEAEKAEKEMEEAKEEEKEEDKEDVNAALMARIESLESLVQKLVEAFEDKPFGNNSPEHTETENEYGDESPVMRSYMKKVNRR